MEKKANKMIACNDCGMFWPKSGHDCEAVKRGLESWKPIFEKLMK